MSSHKLESQIYNISKALGERDQFPYYDPEFEFTKAKLKLTRFLIICYSHVK